jgi:hypothetical protein
MVSFSLRYLPFSDLKLKRIFITKTTIKNNLFFALLKGCGDVRKSTGAMLSENAAEKQIVSSLHLDYTGAGRKIRNLLQKHEEAVVVILSQASHSGRFAERA